MSTEPIRILLIEDERDYARLVEEAVRHALGESILLTWAGTLAAGRQRLRQEPFDVLVVDLGLPDSTGAGGVESLHAAAPALPIVVLSGTDTEETVFDAMQKGAQDYVVKSHLAPYTLARAIQHAIERKRSDDAQRDSERKYRELANSLPEIVCEVDANGIIKFANRNAFREFGYEPGDLEKGINVLQMVVPEDRDRAKADIERMMGGQSVGGREYACLRRDGRVFPALVSADPIIGPKQGAGFRAIIVDITDRKRIETELRQATARLQTTFGQTVNVLSSVIEIRDPYTSGHQRKVALLACAIARDMGFSEDRVEGLRVAGVLHDVGKICVPAEILSKPSALSDGEYQLIKTHAQVGYNILKEVDFPWPVAGIVLQHHERMNGSGYPDGLQGKAILPEARIIGVSDVVEAMSADRPYRPGAGVDKALDEVLRGRGQLYDPEAVDRCVTLFREKGFRWE